MPRWTDINGTAAELGLTPRQVRRAVRAGRIAALVVGRNTVRIDLDALAPTPPQPTQRQVARALRPVRRIDMRGVPDECLDLHD